MTVSVIIPHYNTPDLLQSCVRSFVNIEAGFDVELIVVDNGSICKPDLSAFEDKVKLITEPKPGSYQARNTGIDVSVGDIIVFTDADCIASQQLISVIIKAFENDPKLDLISGNIQITTQSKNFSSVELYDVFTAFQQKKNAKSGFGTTANLAVRRTVFDRIGMFNAETFSGGDVEFTKRATRNGLKLKYLEDAVVFHPPRSSLSEVRQKIIRTTAGSKGLAATNALFKNNLSWRFIVKNLIPPVHLYRNFLERRSEYGLSFSDFFKVFFIAWNLRIFAATTAFKYKFNLSTERPRS